MTIKTWGRLFKDGPDRRIAEGTFTFVENGRKHVIEYRSEPVTDPTVGDLMKHGENALELLGEDNDFDVLVGCSVQGEEIHIEFSR